ncbi:MAG: segregation/condensation protein A [Phycisphaerae bacterium]|nr:segregation/condensation protein A [Phycisphaerae bacterium]
MIDYRVNLDIFAGPLDLLLYLVRKDEVDIYDIPISAITEQYLHHIEMLQALDVDLAGDFLVMAATLMEIKSAMLLPKADPGQEGGVEDLRDPRAELVRQLLEYKRFKDAANLLHAVGDRHGQRFPRPDSLLARLEPQTRTDIDIEQVSVWDLLEAFDTICKATGQRVDLRSIQDDTPIDFYQIEILHRLQTEGPTTFRRLFEDRPNRLVMVGVFLATLELIRGKLVWVEQAQDTGDLYLRALTDEPAEVAVPRVILVTGHAADEVAAQETASAAPTAAPIQIVEVPAVKTSGTQQAPCPEQRESSPPASAPVPIQIVEVPAAKAPSVQPDPCGPREPDATPLAQPTGTDR